MQKLPARLFFTALLVTAVSLNAAEIAPDNDENENALPEQLAKSLDSADTVLVASVNNTVVGIAHNYAVLEVTQVLKGMRDLETVYVGYDPDTEGEVFQIAKTGLWLLTEEQGQPYLKPVEGLFFDDTADLTMVEKTLLEQNSTSPRDIQLEIATDKKKYLLDEPVRVEMTVKNEGNKSVTFDNSLLWRFTHAYSLILETEEGFEKLAIEKPSTGIVGEFAGPRFIRLAPGKSASCSFNLIKLVSDYPPEGKSTTPQFPKCKAYLKISWNTKTLKELFPENTSALAIEGEWSSNEAEFKVAGRELSSVDRAIEAIEEKSGIDNILDAIGSDSENVAKPAAEAFVEYASPGLEPELQKMLTSAKPGMRDAAGRTFLWLAKHPRLTESNALIDCLSKTDSVDDVGAYNEVLSWIASAAIRQGRRDYVEPLVSVLENDKATVLTKKEIVSALSALTKLELSEENFDETIQAVREWLNDTSEKESNPGSKENTSNDEESFEN